jgi:hypothetical protein
MSPHCPSGDIRDDRHLNSVCPAVLHDSGQVYLSRLPRPDFHALGQCQVMLFQSINLQAYKRFIAEAPRVLLLQFRIDSALLAGAKVTIYLFIYLSPDFELAKSTKNDLAPWDLSPQHANRMASGSDPITCTPKHRGPNNRKPRRGRAASVNAVRALAAHNTPPTSYRLVLLAKMHSVHSAPYHQGLTLGLRVALHSKVHGNMSTLAGFSCSNICLARCKDVLVTPPNLSQQLSSVQVTSSREPLPTSGAVHMYGFQVNPFSPPPPITGPPHAWSPA